MAWYSWSQTAASNASADSSINWAEGQAPSSINDSARAMMAATAKYRDDVAGAIVTSGSSTAYTVASYSMFDTLAHLNGQIIAFSPHATNGATVTLNVDGLGAKPLRSSPNVELQAGTIIQGTPYIATYNNSDGAFYLQAFYGNPYNIPLGGGMDYWLPTAPNSAFVFPIGQAVSRTTYAALFAGMGTTYGVGDGSTTFNLPDKRGRVSAAADNMGGTAANNLPGYTAGTTGGAPSVLIAQSGLPNDTLPLVGTAHTWALVQSDIATWGGSTTTNGGGASAVPVAGNMGIAQPTVTVTPSGNTLLNGGVTQTATQTIQPTITPNYILRII